MQALVVVNNDYDEGFGRLFYRQRLDGGELTLHIVKRLSFFDLSRLMLGMIVGRWREDEVLTIESVKTVAMRLKAPRVMVTMDGEVETLTVPLRFSIDPLALSILAPTPPNDATLTPQDQPMTAGSS